AARSLVINGNMEGAQPDQRRRQTQQFITFFETFTYQTQLAAFQISQTAMDEFARPAGSAGGQRRFFQYQDTVAHGGSNLGYGYTLHTSSDDYNIIVSDCRHNSR